MGKIGKANYNYKDATAHFDSHVLLYSKYLLNRLVSETMKCCLTDYYSPAMMGLKTDVEVLSELVKMKSPAVGQLMAQYPGIWMLVVSRWFICLYVDVLPIEVRENRSLLVEIFFLKLWFISPRRQFYGSGTVFSTKALRFSSALP